MRRLYINTLAVAVIAAASAGLARPTPVHAATPVVDGPCDDMLDYIDGVRADCEKNGMTLNLLQASCDSNGYSVIAGCK